MPKLSSTLLLLLSSTLVGCELGEVHDSQGYAGGGKADDGSTSTNLVPPGASAAIAVADCGGNSYNFSPDWEAFTVLFDSNVVVAGRSVDCSVTVEYKFPAGWTFDLPHVDLRGFVGAEEGSGLSIGLAARAGSASDSRQDTLRGPKNEDFAIRLDGGGSAVPCGATSARLSVSLTGNAAGDATYLYGAFDSLDGEIDWRECP